MTTRNKTTFYKKAHKPVPEYGLLAEPLNKAPKITKHGIYNLADIHKKNIGIDSDFQRTLNRKQIDNISKNYDPDNCDLTNVYMHEHQDKFYIQITDGQHRISASPDEVITCRIVNTKASITRCLEANNPKTKSSWEQNALFWGRKAEIDRLRLSDAENINGIIDRFKTLGYTPLNPTKQKAVDIGSNIANLHKQIYNAIKNKLKGRILEQGETQAIVKKVMDDTVDIVDYVFGEEIREGNKTQFGGQIWSGLPQFLLDSREKFGMGGAYDVNLIKGALVEGTWGIGGYHPRKDKLEKFQDFQDATLEYEARKVTGVSGRKADCWQRLFLDMYKLYTN